MEVIVGQDEAHYREQNALHTTDIANQFERREDGAHNPDSVQIHLIVYRSVYSIEILIWPFSDCVHSENFRLMTGQFSERD